MYNSQTSTSVVRHDHRCVKRHGVIAAQIQDCLTRDAPPSSEDAHVVSAIEVVSGLLVTIPVRPPFDYRPGIAKILTASFCAP